MKGIFALILVAFLAVVGCGGSGGGGDGGCDFDILTLANGPNALQADSLWSCTNTADDVYEISVFEDGTGISSAVGVFTWVQTGCRSIELFIDGLSAGDVFNIDGDFGLGFLNYDEQLIGKPETSADCVLVFLL